MTPTDDSDKRRVTSLRDLPQSIEPPPELWQRIAAELDAPAAPVAPAPRRRLPLAAAAAVVLALFGGLLAGHFLLPASQRPAAPIAQQRSASASSLQSTAVPVSLIQDPRYQQQRAQLLSSLAARVAALPPQSRQKVLASLATIQQSMRDLQAALGRDPSNALLQELLVDTCQDEMRVLVSVNEAGQDVEQL